METCGSKTSKISFLTFLREKWVKKKFEKKKLKKVEKTPPKVILLIFFFFFFFNNFSELKVFLI